MDSYRGYTAPPSNTGVIQLIPPVLSSETLLHILLSSEYSDFPPSTTAVFTISAPVSVSTGPKFRRYQMWLCQIDYQSLYLGVEEERDRRRSKELQQACFVYRRAESDLVSFCMRRPRQVVSSDICRNSYQTSCIDYTAASKKAWHVVVLLFHGTACVIKSKPLLNLLSVNSVLCLTGRKKIYCSFHVLKPGKPFLLKGNFITLVVAIADL